jgi:superfamily II DNA/RNA helicase
VAVLHRSLQKHGFAAAALHGDMDQHARMAALDSFRSGEMPLLVASDVAARGLDIPAVSHVFNYDIPHHAEDYVHRIGRTGRAGRAGQAFTLVGPGDEKSLTAIEKLIGQTVEWQGPTLAERPQSEGSSRRRGGRGEERSRGRKVKVRSSGRSQEPSGETREEAPAPRQAPAPREEQPSRNPRRERDRPERDRSSDRSYQGRSRREEDDERVIGLGDHVPAFLMRPVPVKKAK